MTSFFADTTAFIADLPVTVCALLSTSRSLMSSSIVPVILHRDDLWGNGLCLEPYGRKKQQNFLILFSLFSDTMQFTQKLIFRYTTDGASELPKIVNTFLEDLIKNKQYFTSTLQEFEIFNTKIVDAFPVAHPTDGTATATATTTTTSFRNLHTVDLSKCRGFRDQHLTKLITSSSIFPFLKKLHLAPENLTDEATKLLSQLKFLEELNLSFYHGRTLPFLLDLKCLKKLTLQGSRSLIDFDLDESNNDSDAIALLPSLEEIDLVQCDALTDATLDTLQRHAPNLTSLASSRVHQARGFETVSKMSSLKKVRLRGFGSELTEDAVKLLFSNLTVLEDVSISGQVNDVHLLYISQTASWNTLRVIDLLPGSQTSGFTDVGFRHLMLASFPKLESVTISINNNPNFTGDIGGCSSDEDTDQDSNDTTNNNNNLKHLELYANPHLSDKGILSIMRKFSASLTKLQIGYSSQITSEGLENAFNTVKSSSSVGTNNNNNKNVMLETLDLESCKGLKDLHFLTHLESLMSLNLACTQLDFTSIRESDNFHMSTRSNDDDNNNNNNNNNNKNSNHVAKLDPPEGFCALPRSVKQLSLSFTDVCDTDVINISSVVSQSLTHLRLFGCKNITDKSLIEGISSNLHNLEYLSIDNAFSPYDKGNQGKKDPLTIDAIESAVTRLPRLQHLKLGRTMIMLIEGDNNLKMKLGRLVLNNNNDFI